MNNWHSAPSNSSKTMGQRRQKTKQSRNPKAARVWDRVVKILSTAVLAAMVVIPLVLCFESTIEQRELSEHGVSTVATVTKQFTTERLSGRGSSTNYLVSYRFETTTDQTGVQSTTQLPRDDWGTYPVGSSITVTYAAESPSDNLPNFMLKQYPVNLAGALSIVMGLLIPVLIWLTWRGFKKLKKRWNSVPGADVTTEQRANKRSRRVYGRLTIILIVLGIPLTLILSMIFLGPWVVKLMQATFL